MKNKKQIYLIYIIIVAFFTAVVAFTLKNLISLDANQAEGNIDDNSSSQAQSFIECEENGGVIMESYPRKCQNEDGNVFTEEIGNILQLNDQIRIESIYPNQKITFPLEISGEVTGVWFFEGNFSADLLDEEGNILSQAIITSSEDTMTEDFVPFSGTIQFENPNDLDKVWLHLVKANPSDLRELDETLKIPLYIQKKD